MATWIGAADGAPPAVAGSPRSVLTAIWFHVVTGLPVAPWAAGVVVVRLLSTSAAAATAPIKIRLDFIASPLVRRGRDRPSSGACGWYRSSPAKDSRVEMAIARLGWPRGP